MQSVFPVCAEEQEKEKYKNEKKTKKEKEWLQILGAFCPILFSE